MTYCWVLFLLLVASIEVVSDFKINVRITAWRRNYRLTLWQSHIDNLFECYCTEHSPSCTGHYDRVDWKKEAAGYTSLSQEQLDHTGCMAGHDEGYMFNTEIPDCKVTTVTARSQGCEMTMNLFWNYGVKDSPYVLTCLCPISPVADQHGSSVPKQDASNNHDDPIYGMFIALGVFALSVMLAIFLYKCKPTNRLIRGLFRRLMLVLWHRAEPYQENFNAFSSPKTESRLHPKQNYVFIASDRRRAVPAVSDDTGIEDLNENGSEVHPAAKRRKSARLENQRSKTSLSYSQDDSELTEHQGTTSRYSDEPKSTSRSMVVEADVHRDFHGADGSSSPPLPPRQRLPRFTAPEEVSSEPTSPSKGSGAPIKGTKTALARNVSSTPKLSTE